jgi:hypothetical protein
VALFCFRYFAALVLLPDSGVFAVGEFRAEFVNVYNPGQLGLPSSTIGNILISIFGFVTQANPARIRQTGVKFFY